MSLWEPSSQQRRQWRHESRVATPELVEPDPPGEERASSTWPIPVLQPSGSRSIGAKEPAGWALHGPTHKGVNSPPLSRPESEASLIETNHSYKMAKRQHKIDLVKRTINYKRFISEVPKELRHLSGVRRTPDKEAKVGRESWDSMVRKWKFELLTWARNAPISDTFRHQHSQSQIETDPDILYRRQKQIEYVKNSKNYKLYAREVPRDSRRSWMPQTPDTKRKLLKENVWETLVKKWKLDVHQWAEDWADGKLSHNNAQQSSTRQGSRKPGKAERAGEKGMSRSRSHDGQRNRDRSHSRENREQCCQTVCQSCMVVLDCV